MRGIDVMEVDVGTSERDRVERRYGRGRGGSRSL